MRLLVALSVFCTSPILLKGGSPSNYYSGVNDMGQLDLTIHMMEVGCKNAKIPLVLRFNPASQIKNIGFGDLWKIPLFDSKIWQCSQYWYGFKDIAGNHYYFRKIDENKKNITYSTFDKSKLLKIDDKGKDAYIENLNNNIRLYLYKNELKKIYVINGQTYRLIKKGKFPSSFEKQNDNYQISFEDSYANNKYYSINRIIENKKGDSVSIDYQEIELYDSSNKLRKFFLPVKLFWDKNKYIEIKYGTSSVKLSEIFPNRLELPSYFIKAVGPLKSPLEQAIFLHKKSSLYVNEIVLSYCVGDKKTDKRYQWISESGNIIKINDDCFLVEYKRPSNNFSYYGKTVINVFGKNKNLLSRWSFDFFTGQENFFKADKCLIKKKFICSNGNSFLEPRELKFYNKFGHLMRYERYNYSHSGKRIRTINLKDNNKL